MNTRVLRNKCRIYRARRRRWHRRSTQRRPRCVGHL
jgi:hypothetical protein